MANYSVHLNQAAIERVVGGYAKKAADRASSRLATSMGVQVTEMGLIGDGIDRPAGQLAASFYTTDKTTVALKPTFWVRSRVAYAVFLEKGTRAHGPVRASMLVFRPKFAPAGVRVFAKWVRGVRAYGFMNAARLKMTIRDFLP